MPETFGTPAFGARGVVAAPHYLASLAGIQALREGGSAVDAALAANMVMAVVWPHMCGPGGDLFAQVWNASERKLYGLNASGRAGRGMSGEAYRSLGHSAMPQRGVLAITVPGAVDGWFALHERFGKLAFSDVARHAISQARNGFRLTAAAAGAIRANAELLSKTGGGAATFTPNGRLPRAGDELVQPDLANTFDQLAREAREAMYTGSLGARIAEFLTRHGSRLEFSDFADQRSEWVEPISVEYRGVQVCELPPNSQGVALLEILNMLEGFDVGAHEQPSAELVHQLVERKKLAFSDRDSFVADPRCSDVPIESLLDARRAREKAQRIGPTAAAEASRTVGRSVDGD